MSDEHFSLADGNGNRLFIDAFGTGEQYRIRVRDKDYFFCWSDQFGPCPETKKGETRNLGPYDPFWRAASLWALQGRQIDADGLCKWHEPRKPTYEVFGRVITKVIDEGEPHADGAIIHRISRLPTPRKVRA